MGKFWQVDWKKLRFVFDKFHVNLSLIESIGMAANWITGISDVVVFNYYKWWVIEKNAV